MAKSQKGRAGTQKQAKARASREQAIEEAMKAMKAPKPKPDTSEPPLHLKDVRSPPADAAPARPARSAADTEEGRVLYIGHIPHGFYEDQMRGFFSQFGEVTHVRLSRNKKTGASKHFAFIEFKHPAVARIAADTMDNYLMFGQVLKVKVVAPSEVHADTFKGADKPFKVVPWRKLAAQQHNKERTVEEFTELAKSIVRGERAKRRKIAAAGIDYEFPGYESALALLPPMPKDLPVAAAAPEAPAAAAGKGKGKAAAAEAAADPKAAPAAAAGKAEKAAAAAGKAEKAAAAAGKAEKAAAAAAGPKAATGKRGRAAEAEPVAAAPKVAAEGKKGGGKKAAAVPEEAVAKADPKAAKRAKKV